jgi:probable rRNA maturation factor
MEINILVGPRFQEKVSTGLLKRAAVITLETMATDRDVELELLITGDVHIRELNRRWRGLDRPTDVLSFAMQEEGPLPFIAPENGPKHLGEVVISFPRARRQAARLGHSVEQELACLVIHGILHLLGMDHQVESEARNMEAMEADILSKVLEVER